jgi:hypothetical protein
MDQKPERFLGPKPAESEVQVPARTAAEGGKKKAGCSATAFATRLRLPPTTQYCVFDMP